MEPINVNFTVTPETQWLVGGIVIAVLFYLSVGVETAKKGARDGWVAPHESPEPGIPAGIVVALWPAAWVCLAAVRASKVFDFVYRQAGYAKQQNGQWHKKEK